jgi:hypothetical protein
LQYPDIEITITEIKDMEGIRKYILVFIAPGLGISEKVVFDLWIPKKDRLSMVERSYSETALPG